ncbi:SMI1/KNR4 family protein [Brevundimonas sp. Root1279]|uniref:SMI1/KNR4 family protein n=1 Tax=Brevundimonas sp. Root1279 TaxID=1736443 RepID=UPI0006FF879B|nr:SMI1/KNR4 family protein [Brevundimonas sp. Root1279]KQW83857.1 hypothetical protein ASC65_04255 [Brevundimonas sp. Root1279]
MPVATLARLDDVELGAPIDASVLRDRLASAGVHLPLDHLEFLIQANGLTAYAGYYRLFGVDAPNGCMISWNQPEMWKFAWAGRCDQYWSFGETGWGDQYAYRLGDPADQNVYYLDAFAMTAEPIVASFTEFLQSEFLTCAVKPFDEMTARARERFGQLPADAHLVYSPSILLGGAEHLDRIQMMPARAAMIVNGDIAVQLDAAPDGAMCGGMRPYLDDLGRTRVTLEWSV